MSLAYPSYWGSDAPPCRWTDVYGVYPRVGCVAGNRFTWWIATCRPRCASKVGPGKVPS